MDHLLSDGGYLAEPLVDQSAYRVEPVRLYDHVETVAKVVQARAGVHDVLVLGCLLDLRLPGVELVLDLPDDLLEQVLDGDDALCSAVLVDDDGDMDSRLLELGEQLFESLRLRDEEGFPQHLLRKHGGVIRRVVEDLEEVSCVDQPLDMVECAAIDRQAAVSRLDHPVDDIRNRRAYLHSLHVHARHHDLAGDGRIKLYDAADHPHLELFKRLALVVDRHVKVGCEGVGG